jgi:hypothetical protein
VTSSVPIFTSAAEAERRGNPGREEAPRLLIRRGLSRGHTLIKPGVRTVPTALRTLATAPISLRPTYGQRSRTRAVQSRLRNDAAATKVAAQRSPRTAGLLCVLRREGPARRSSQKHRRFAADACSCRESASPTFGLARIRGPRLAPGPGGWRRAAFWLAHTSAPSPAAGGDPEVSRLAHTAARPRHRGTSSARLRPSFLRMDPTLRKRWHRRGDGWRVARGCQHTSTTARCTLLLRTDRDLTVPLFAPPFVDRTRTCPSDRLTRGRFGTAFQFSRPESRGRPRRERQPIPLPLGRHR